MNTSSPRTVAWAYCIAALGWVLLLPAPCSAQTPPLDAQGEGSPPLSPEQIQRRLRWNIKTLREAYDSVGRKDPRWDTPAREALQEFANTLSGASTNTGVSQQRIAEAARKAVQAGCDDPLLLYVRARHRVTGESSGRAELRDAVEALKASKYPPVRKHFACFRLAQSGTNTADVEAHYRQAGQYLADTLQDASMPAEEVFVTCEELLMTTRRRGHVHEAIYRAIEKPLFQNWPSNATAFLIQGIYLWQRGWTFRGRGTIDTVTAGGYDRFRDLVKQSAAALEKAWELDPTNPRIARERMRLETDGDRDQLDLWFRRAMKLHPGYYEAASGKLLSLEPQWGGSKDEMLKFARECARSPDWGDNLSLILIDAHRMLEAYTKYYNPSVTNYWRDPEVWPDVKSAYERYLKFAPNSRTHRSRFAVLAYNCGQWETFLRMIEERPEQSRFEEFQGKEGFDRMVGVARRRLAASQPK